MSATKKDCPECGTPGGCGLTVPACQRLAIARLRGRLAEMERLLRAVASGEIHVGPWAIYTSDDMWAARTFDGWLRGPHGPMRFPHLLDALRAVDEEMKR